MDTRNLIRWAGLPLIVAGIIFAGIQPIHPADVVASVTTSAWAIITPLKTMMSLFFLLGITGLYARQAHKAGWLGLAGFLLFGLCWALQTAYIFAEAFILPLLATTAPQFVDGILGAVSGRASQVNLGALPTLYISVGILYMLGGLLFGIATFRAGVLPRWAGGLLAITAALTPLAALLPHQIQRLAAMPMGLALAWLGYALWSERREQAAGIMFIVSGVLLRITNANGFLATMPAFIPYPLLMVYVSGALEALGGLALLLPLRPLHKAAGVGLALLLIAVFPANINVAVNGIQGTGFFETPLLQWIRLGLQPVFIVWVLWAAHILQPEETLENNETHLEVFCT